MSLNLVHLLYRDVFCVKYLYFPVFMTFILPFAFCVLQFAFYTFHSVLQFSICRFYFYFVCGVVEKVFWSVQDVSSTKRFTFWREKKQISNLLVKISYTRKTNSTVPDLADYWGRIPTPNSFSRFVLLPWHNVSFSRSTTQHSRKSSVSQSATVRWKKCMRRSVRYSLKTLGLQNRRISLKPSSTS